MTKNSEKKGHISQRGKSHIKNEGRLMLTENEIQNQWTDDHFIPTRLAKMKTFDNLLSWRRQMQTDTHVHCCLWENKLAQVFEDKSGTIYKNLECLLPLTHHLYFYEFISQINSYKYAKLYVQDVPCCFLIITASNTQMLRNSLNAHQKVAVYIHYGTLLILWFIAMKMEWRHIY